MAIAGFKLRINGGGLVNVIVDVGYTFSHDFTGLLESTAYSVEFADYDTDGTLSDWSPALSATTPACPGPSVVTLLVDDGGNALVDDGGNALVEIS